MAGISQTGLYRSLIDPAGKKYAGADAKSRTSEAIMMDKIRGADPERADALEKRLNDSRQVIAQLSNSKSNAAQSKKAAAAEKVKRIKAEIQMLKTMGGDPKLVARHIARLARELKAAAREYASAGSTSGAAGEPAANSSNNHDSGGSAVESGVADNQAVSVETPSATSGTGDASAPPVKVEQEDSTQNAEVASAVTTGAALTEGERQYQDARRQKFKDDLQKEAAKIMGKTADAEADRAFAQEVRTQAALLKALAKQMKQRLNRAGDRGADSDLEQTRKALAEVEKSLSDITGGVHLTV